MSGATTNPDDFDLLGLDEVIARYDYGADPILQGGFKPIEQELCRHIETYGEGINDFGQQMAAHLERTSETGEAFLVEGMGFSMAAGLNFYHANLLQDLGKIHPGYDPEIWDLPHRPTDEERAEKRKHVHRGPEILDQAIEDAPFEVKTHPHVAIVVPAIMLFHHERVDGSGPYGRKGDEMGAIIKTACIVDTMDGDMIPRAHQPAARTQREALRRMKGLEGEPGKYAGAFDDTLDAYILFCEEKTGEHIL